MSEDEKALRSLSTPQSLIYICMPIKSAIKSFHILCCHIKYYIYILCMCHSISFSFSLQIRSMVCGWACARKSILSTHRYSLRTKREKEIVTPKTVIEPIGKYFKSLANWRKKIITLVYLHYDVMSNVSRMADSTELKTKLLRFYLAYIYLSLWLSA